MKILAVGPFWYTNNSFVYDKLNEVHSREPITGVVEGGMSGIDAFIANWARREKVPCTTVRWGGFDTTVRTHDENHREQLFAEKPDVLLVFRRDNGAEPSEEVEAFRRIAIREGIPIMDLVERSNG